MSTDPHPSSLEQPSGDTESRQSTKAQLAEAKTYGRRMGRLNKADPHPPRLEVLLFHDHPPIGERLAMAEMREEAP